MRGDWRYGLIVAGLLAWQGMAWAACSDKRSLLINRPVEQTIIDQFGPIPTYYSYLESTGGKTIYGSFVPMLPEPLYVTTEAIAQVRTHPSQTLLTFNEPDGGTQHLSPGDALNYWPLFESLGVRLSSPAVSLYAAGPKVWLDDFMTLATAQGRRVDFIAIHWYGNITGGSPTPQQGADELIRQMQEVYARWGRPIWLTEFALWLDAGSSYAAQLEFMQLALPRLDALPFVEKYFWWTPNHYVDAQRPGWTNSLADATMQLNALGLYYRDCAGGSVPPPSPPLAMLPAPYDVHVGRLQ